MFAKDKIIERIVRVDQAGEIGAQRIYNGQRFVYDWMNLNHSVVKILHKPSAHPKDFGAQVFV